MASEDKGLVSTGNLSKMDDDADDAKSSSELNSKNAENAVIELNSTRNSDLNTSDCVLINDSNESAVETTVDSDELSGADKQSPAKENTVDTPADDLAVNFAENSGVDDADSSIDGVSSDNNLAESTEPLEMSVNADSTVTGEGTNITQNPTDESVSEMESDAPNDGDETDFVAQSTANEEILAQIGEQSIDCEKSKKIVDEQTIEQSDAMANESVILLDTPEKGDQPTMVSDDTANDKSIGIDDSLPAQMVDECISSIVESAISDPAEQMNQSIVTEADSEIKSMEIGDESLDKLVAEPQSEGDAALSTPKKADCDISVIDISTPSENMDTNAVDTELATGSPTPLEKVQLTETLGEKSLENESDVAATGEESDSAQPAVAETSHEKSSEKDTGVVTTGEKCGSEQPSLEEPIAHIIDTTNTELEKSDEQIEDESLLDINVAESALEAPGTPDIHADVISELENMISETEANIAAESLNATVPVAAEKSGETGEDAVTAPGASLLDEECQNIESASDNTTGEEMSDAPELLPAENDVEQKLAESNDKIDVSMEANDTVLLLVEADAPVSMDVDENDTDSSMLCIDEDKMDCEEEADEKEAEENAKELENPDESKTESLNDDTQPDSTSAADELSTSTDKEEKTPERASFIRVKSMAFLFSDATPSTDAKIDEKGADHSETATDNNSTTAAPMDIEQPVNKTKPKPTRLLANVLKKVLGSPGLDSVEQTDSDSEARSPQTEPASPAVDVQEPALVLEVTSTRESHPEVKECLNIECSHKSQDFFEAPEFVISHFHITKKRKMIYVCDECFESAIAKYGELGGALEDKQPLYLEEIPRRPELVEILDSSDEEDSVEDSQKKRKSDDANGSTQTSTLPSDALALIENELENVIAASLERININEQMKWNRQILDQKFTHQLKMSQSILNELKQLQRTADRIYKDTYKGLNCFVEEISSYDSETHSPFHMSDANYPPSGEFQHEKELDPMKLYYTIRKNLISAWTPCRFLEKADDSELLKVQLLRPGKNKNLFRMEIRKHMAYGKAPTIRLEVGTRVIALFKLLTAPTTKHATFYPGIIAEPLREYNKWRYLVFFDDGYAQYVEHEDVRVVCEASANVWEDVVAESREFIQTYLLQFSKMRPMVQVQRGQRMMTEYGGKWINALVIAVDASLVQMYFEDEKRYEWIYRGSTRLGPLFRQNKQLNKPKSAPKVVNLVDTADKTNLSEGTERSSSSSEAPPIQRRFPAQATRDTPQVQREKREQAEQQEKEKRAVAKKSSSLPPRPTVQHLNNSTIYVDEDNKPKGKVVYYTAKRHLPPRKYTTHECSPSCLFQITHNLSTYSPLSKPLLSGWERQICKAKGKKTVVYKAPCGRRLRNMSELHRYLRMTNCSLNVENFDYDFMIHCLAEYVIDTCIINKPDISEGVENMLVPCVNYYDHSMPPPCVYSAKRIPTEGVNLNLDGSFMCGCDCTDDCLDKTKCACWQLTIAGAKYGNPYTPAEEIGYEFKRLPEPVPTGIYECNSSCKCKSNCLNRVAQQPLQMKLQVFKTGNRGWGLRCLNDVPKGSFICCYAGNLLTEQVANEAGENLGDEYYAELDYIEVVETLKEGYEPDVVKDDDPSSEDEFDPDTETNNKDDSDDEFVSKAYVGERRIKTRYRTRNSIDKKKDEKKKEEKKKEEKKRDGDDSSDEERQPISFMPSQTPMQEENTATKSIRKFFGKNESVYIMDAKKTGNIGRYFNHSCAPNLFVQNVFVDTHDLRFPWVAFFASSHIRAGTELTWNYNYDVGSVPGKVLFCQCGADNCRGRLL